MGHYMFRSKDAWVVSRVKYRLKGYATHKCTLGHDNDMYRCPECRRYRMEKELLDIRLEAAIYREALERIKDGSEETFAKEIANNSLNKYEYPSGNQGIFYI